MSKILRNYWQYCQAIKIKKMGKKVVFNYETLSFEHQKFSLVKFIVSVIPHLIITTVVGLSLAYFLYNNTTTPKVSKLQSIQNQLVNSFDILNSKLGNQSYRLGILEERDDNTYRSVLMLPAISSTDRYLSNVSNIRKSNEHLKNEELITQVMQRNNSINNRIRMEADSYKELSIYAKNRDNMFKSMPSIWPVPKKYARISRGFGMEMHPILHVMKMHTGIDLAADRGTPVYAVGDGIVVRADNTSGGYGNCIRINHGYSYLTFYAHLSKILVVPGQKVRRGQLIGLVGTTGRSTGPHLHYEVRINGKPVNPINYLFNDMTQGQYEELIKNAQKQTAMDN